RRQWRRRRQRLRTYQFHRRGPRGPGGAGPPPGPPPPTRHPEPPNRRRAPAGRAPPTAPPPHPRRRGAAAAAEPPRLAREAEGETTVFAGGRRGGGRGRGGCRPARRRPSLRCTRSETAMGGVRAWLPRWAADLTTTGEAVPTFCPQLRTELSA